MTGTVLLCSVCLTTPTPPLSMGGAIAVHIASRELLGPCLIGLVVIDVVEGALVSSTLSSPTKSNSTPPPSRS